MNTLKRNLYFYLGRNEAHDYVANKLDNMLLIGNTATGRPEFLNNMLVRLTQETNPKELDLYVYDCSGTAFGKWVENVPEGKVLPHFKDVIVNGLNGKAIDNAMKTLTSIYDSIHYKVFDMPNNNDVANDSITTLFIIDRIDILLNSSYGEKAMSLLKYILYYGNLFNVHIVASTTEAGFNSIQEIVDLFYIKVCTPIVGNDSLSNYVVGYNCAAIETDEKSIAWVKVGSKVPFKLYVPSYPNTWLNKFIRIFSVYENPMEFTQ